MAKVTPITYIDFQADVGITKHPGGVRMTDELVDLCKINEKSYVLDVGCGIGTTTCYLAKKYGCRVVGIDSNVKMIEWSKKWAKEQKVWDKVKFMVADAQNLPFDENTFDAVISESVLSFIIDKNKAMKEFVRVVKKGGYVGINETISTEKKDDKWVDDMLQQHIDIWDKNQLKKLFLNVGLKEVKLKVYKISLFGELKDRLNLIKLKRLFLAWTRLIFGYLTNSEYRKRANEMMGSVKVLSKFTKQFGEYGLIVGKK